MYLETCSTSVWVYAFAEEMATRTASSVCARSGGQSGTSGRGVAGASATRSDSEHV